MFDLDAAVGEKTDELAANRSLSRDDADALESQLRNTIADLKSHELTDYEAFAIASYRLDDASTFVPQSSQNTTDGFWRDRTIWMIFGYLGFTLASSVIYAVAELASLGVTLSGGGPESATLISMGSAVFGWCLFFVTIYRLSTSPKWGGDKVPITWALGAIGGYVIAFLIRQGGVIVRSRSVSSSTLSESVYWQAMGNVVLQCAIFLTCIIMLWTIDQSGANRERDQQERFD